MHFNIYKVTTFLQKGDKTTFDYPVAMQYSYMDSLKRPLNDVDRSYNQFLCQDFFVPKLKRLLWDLISVFATPCVLVVFIIKGIFCKFERKVDAVGENKGMEEIIPEQLSAEYVIDRASYNVDFVLTKQDLLYISQEILGWRRPYFVFKSIMKIANYSASIVKFRPRAFIVHSEISFCSSMLTNYCGRFGVRHINVMHGDKLKYIREAFFRFDKCYVWDQFYIDLFVRQYAEDSQFVIAIPPSLKVGKADHIDKSIYADYKYYLAIYTDEEARALVNAMSVFKTEGKTIKYRIHPRCSDLNILKKYVNDEEIEYPSKVNIIDSLRNTGCAVGSYSTVLLQAYCSDIPVLLDDVAYADTFNKLKEYGYILMSKDIAKLSNYTQ